MVRINAEARDQALGYALLAIAAIGLIGLVAAFLLPRDKRPSEPLAQGPDAALPLRTRGQA